VEEFLRQAMVVLKPGGTILLQIINYKRILDQKLSGLPTIDNEEIKFERIYQYPDNPSHVQFKTRLTIKATGDNIENDVPLLALLPNRLMQILKDSGFSSLEEFGSFKKDPFNTDSQPLILKAQK